MERSNTHTTEDELENLTLGVEEEEQKEVKNTFNHPFCVLCKEMKDYIESADIEELREYLNSDSMKMSVIRLHDYYKQHIEDLPNTSIIKQEIDGILSYLTIAPEKLIVKLQENNNIIQ